jgi:F0F1-type ATP synthase epsilon subunit
MTIVDEHDEKHYIPVDSGFLEVDSGSKAKILVEEAK